MEETKLMKYGFLAMYMLADVFQSFGFDKCISEQATNRMNGCWSPGSV